MPHPTVPYVLAAPGYLAGGGDWEHLTEWLLRGHGWRNVSTIDQHTALASPDGRLQVALDRRAAWTWTLRATTPAGREWAATLGAHLPVEYVTTLVDTMLRPACRHRPDVLGPLHTAGWNADAAAPAPTAVSPDGLVRFTEETALSPTRGPWHAACMVNGYRWWAAVFSTHTPPGLVAAFTQSLASDDPLPHGHRHTAVRIRALHPHHPNLARLRRRTGAARSADRRRPWPPPPRATGRRTDACRQPPAASRARLTRPR